MTAECSSVDLGCLADLTCAAALSQITTPPASRTALSGPPTADRNAAVAARIAVIRCNRKAWGKANSHSADEAAIRNSDCSACFRLKRAHRARGPFRDI